MRNQFFGRLCFSLSTFPKTAIVLANSFTESLPLPWWAPLTIYVTVQSMAGAFRSKVLFRLVGIATCAIDITLIAPDLRNSPLPLVVRGAIWIGLRIDLAVLDRTPGAFLFQMG